ncbi:MAG: hypothetical protein HOQ01_05480, partial [Lysobacter sp.]|nr:hypothetical protein [Lysobacter sp.]
RLVQLAPHRQVSSLQPAMRADLLQPAIADAPAATLQAISFYETAAHAFRDGGMRRLGREPQHERNASDSAALTLL